MMEEKFDALEDSAELRETDTSGRASPGRGVAAVGVTPKMLGQQSDSAVSPVHRVVIACSPKAGAGDGAGLLSAFRTGLEERGVAVEQISDLGRLERLLGENLSPDGMVLVAAGGDGTLNLMASLVGARVPIMPLPLGTENLVARHYGLFQPRVAPDADAMVRTALWGEDRAIDAGLAQFEQRDGTVIRERLFLIMASVGFDADVVRRMHLTRRGHIRRWSYWKPILASLRKYRYPAIRVSVEGVARPETAGAPKTAATLETTGMPETAGALEVAWAWIFNLPRYAAGLEIEKSAREDDGVLDFCGLTRGSHLQSLRYLWGVLTGRHRRWRDVIRRPVASVSLSSDARVAVQLDGDYAGRLPMRIRVSPRHVVLRVPAS